MKTKKPEPVKKPTPKRGDPQIGQKRKAAARNEKIGKYLNSL